MNWPLTFEEVRDLRRRGHRCVNCGRHLPPHPEVQMQEQLAKVKFAEAVGIRRAQDEINATLTDKYLQHEAIAAQRAMANSKNHTQIYIPSGQNGIPIVRTTDDATNAGQGNGE